MSVFRLDRSRRAGPLLEWKVRVFAAGAVLGLAGIYLEQRWLSGAAIVVLLAGAILGLKRVRSEDDEGSD